MEEVRGEMARVRLIPRKGTEEDRFGHSQLCWELVQMGELEACMRMATYREGIRPVHPKGRMDCDRNIDMCLYWYYTEEGQSYWERVHCDWDEYY